MGGQVPSQWLQNTPAGLLVWAVDCLLACLACPHINTCSHIDCTKKGGGGAARRGGAGPTNLWSTFPPADDQPDARAVIERWTKRFKLASKPKYMFGVSSGAAFAIKFPKVMKLQGVVSGG